MQGEAGDQDMKNMKEQQGGNSSWEFLHGLMHSVICWRSSLLLQSHLHAVFGSRYDDAAWDCMNYILFGWNYTQRCAPGTLHVLEKQ